MQYKSPLQLFAEQETEGEKALASHRERVAARERRNAPCDGASVTNIEGGRIVLDRFGLVYVIVVLGATNVWAWGTLINHYVL